MATNEPATQGEAAAKCPIFNIQKLDGLPPEQKGLYILTYSADLLNFTGSLDKDAVSAHQILIKKELMQQVSLTDPAPSKAIRTNIGRCFGIIFTKGNRKTLYESINDLVNLVNGGKEKDIRTKHAAIYCLGIIFAAAGDSAISLSGLTCSSILRALKQAHNHAGLRSTIFNSFTKLVGTVTGSLDESVAKEIWSNARKVAQNDKAIIVQASAAKALEALVEFTPYFDTLNEFEALKLSLVRTFESGSPTVRHASAACLAAAFLKHFVEDTSKPLPRVKKPKKTSGKQAKGATENNDDDDIPTTEPAAGKATTDRLTFGLRDILKQLSILYNRPTTNNRGRASVACCYLKFLKTVGTSIVESQYSLIADHFLFDLLSHPHINSTRYRLLLTRKFVRILLEDVVGLKILGEAGQISAATSLVNSFLKNYPQVIKERPEPSKSALTGALSALASLIKSLGPATSSIAELVRDGLLQVLQHPSYTVQIATSYTLRCFTVACPQQNLPCVNICMESVEREIGNPRTPQYSARRCVGYANGLAAIISTSPIRPLYGSVDINAKVFALATGMLKLSGESELRASGTQIQVAWILIGGLMSLGPNFVKIHLAQLLLLWKNALPKAIPTESTSQRSLLEYSFLAHVRECALGSMLAFLEFNSKLLTTDVSKRLATMLQNTTGFLNSLPEKKTSEDINQRLSPALHLQDLDLMVRRRVLQIYAKLVTTSPAGASDVLMQSNLLTMAVTFFADPEEFSPNSLSTSIANAVGNFETVWETGDNVSFGINGLIRGFENKHVLGESQNQNRRHLLTRTGPTASIDSTLMMPILGAKEHDSLSLYTNIDDGWNSDPDPACTEVVNAAIILFAVSLPLQVAKIQESILEQIATFLASGSLHRDPGRRAALTANISLALLITLKVALKETKANAGDIKGSQVEKIFQELLRNFVIDADPIIRSIGYEALGRLCSNSGNNLTTVEINYLVDMIVTNREPSARAGCAVALGCIHAEVGGMAAGLHLKTIYGILMSLASDPHPTVHFWAMEGLSRVGESAGLTFAGYVPSALGMLSQAYVSDTHNDEVSQTGFSNLEIQTPTNLVIARCLDTLVNVLGPDLQDIAKARDMILTLIRQLEIEEDPLILMEGLRCLENFSLYASNHMDFTVYVQKLQEYIASPHEPLRNVAIDGLYNLVKRNALDVVEVATVSFNDDLWMALNDSPRHDGIRNILWSWLEQTCQSNTIVWLQRCQDVLTKTLSIRDAQQKSVPAESAVTIDLQDEEVAGFAAEPGVTKDEGGTAPGAGQEPLKWQVRMFALECLSYLLATVEKEMFTDEPSESEIVLQQRLSDVIRIAFSASTANAVELRVWGLRIIDQVLKMFGKTPDPDFAEVSLLEQYQAQISSALTPAFAADSSPELASAAVSVCASFIATGIVTEVDRMGRILKLLISTLDSFSGGTDTTTIGDLSGLSSNAQVMVKMAVFSAWAELQIASLEQKYLLDVVSPQIAKLTPLWLESLQEYARLRFEPDISMNNGPPSVHDSPDVVYSALNRETLLQFYQDSWLKLVDAIASLIEQDSELVFNALDGKAEAKSVNGAVSGHDINYRDEPAAFFFVLFGITFEALALRSANDSLIKSDQTHEILLALRKILRPSISGQAIYQEVVFSETMDLLDRLVLTEGLVVQSVVVEIARDMCISHPSARAGHSSTSNDNLSEDIEQLFELTRIIVLALGGLIPSLSENGASSRQHMSDEATNLIRTSLDALVNAAEVFPTVIKTDLHACIFHIFSTILATGFAQASIVPQALPIFKRFVQSITKKSSRAVVTQVRGCFQKFWAILRKAQHRETEASLSCVKNSLLASTILLTGGINIIPENDPLLTRFLDELLDCLTDRMCAKVASNCIRSLLGHPSKNASDIYITLYLIPRLLAFITDSNTEDPVDARALIVQALVSFMGTLSAEQGPQYLSTLVPALLVRAEAEGRGLYNETASRFLELAAMNGPAFRSVAGTLAPEQKTLLEGIVREGGRRREETASKNLANGDEQEAPTIALKMNFGG